MEGGHDTPSPAEMGWTLGAAVLRALARMRVVIVTVLLIGLYAGFVGSLTASGVFNNW